MNAHTGTTAHRQTPKHCTHTETRSGGMECKGDVLGSVPAYHIMGVLLQLTWQSTCLLSMQDSLVTVPRTSEQNEQAKKLKENKTTKPPSLQAESPRSLREAVTATRWQPSPSDRLGWRWGCLRADIVVGGRGDSSVKLSPWREEALKNPLSAENPSVI